MSKKIGNKRKVKVALDISPTQDANAKRGVGFYTKHLAAALQKLTQSNSEYRHWQIDLVNQTPNTKRSLAHTHDLIHYPYFDPFFPTLPLHPPLPSIVTVHDLIPLRFKKHYPVGFKGSLVWQRQKYALKKSSFIVTDSSVSKYDINRFTGYPLDYIYSIPLAANPLFKKLSPVTLKSQAPKIKAKYSLPSKFVLYVGDINWNKNIPNLVKACEQLNYSLVIVGSAPVRPNVSNHPWNRDLLWLQNHSKILKRQRSNILKLPGFVPDKDLLVIYHLATLYCQPSYWEGFGLPALDAMACNCPVLYSREGSLEELMAYCGPFFDPWKKGDLKRKLKRLWESPTLQEKYRQLGLKRAQVFSWEQTALSTIGVYELALSQI